MKSFYLKNSGNEKDLKFALDMIEEEIENYFLSQDIDSIIPQDDADDSQPMIIYTMLNDLTYEMQEYFLDNSQEQDRDILLN